MYQDASVMLGESRMDYAAFGQEKKIFVVLPGLSDGLISVRGKAWMLSLPYKKFLQNYTIYMFSRKDPMPDGYSIREMARDQALALRKLGIKKCCLMGVSQGGMIAQYMAADSPDLVRKLILAVTAPNAAPLLQETVGGWTTLAERGDYTALLSDTARKMYSEAYYKKNKKIFPLLAKLMKPEGAERFLINARAILSFDIREELTKISCPTLILAGSNDCVVGPEAASALREGISGSRLHVYNGLGHGAYEEARDFYDRVLEFCAENSSPWRFNMSLYAIGDLHLHYQSVLKSQAQLHDRVWKNHEEKFRRNCDVLLTEEDTLVLVGDHSWGKKLSECTQDLQYISDLPGRKILTRGNHDHFWEVNKTGQLNELYKPALTFLQDSYESYRDYAIVGTKGYTFEGPFYLDHRGRITGWDEKEEAHAKKLVERELVRLRKSFTLAQSDGYRKFIMFLHYPPTNILEERSGFTDMAEEFGAEQVIYAHCHGEARFHDSIQGESARSR